MSRLYPILAALSLIVIAGCTKEPGPTDPSDTGGTGQEVAMTTLSPLPADSGNTTSIAITPDNGFIAVIDGKLAAIDPAGAISTINADATHLAVARSPSGDLYAVTRTELRRYDATTGSVVSAPIPQNGPLSANGRVEAAEIRFSPTGEPFITLISNYPRTYTYFSTDRGTTWQALTFPSGATNLAYTGDVIFTKGGDLLAGDYGGLFTSSDRGATWTKLTAQMPNFAIKLVATGNGDIYRYIPGGGNLSISHDGGRTFIDLTQTNTPPLFTGIREGGDGALYALANTSSAGSLSIDRRMSFLRSTDGGVTWQHLLFTQAYDFAMRGETIGIAVAGTDATFRREIGGIYISRDRGTTWTTAGLAHTGAVQDFAFESDGTLMILADNGLYRKTASGWTTLGSQPNNFFRIATGGGRMVVANFSSFLITGDGGRSWSEGDYPNYQPPGIGSVSLSALIPLKSGDFLLSLTTYRSDLSLNTNGQLYKIGPDGTARKITGVGATFESLVEDPDGVIQGTEQVLDPISSTFSARTYKSTDGGETWTETTSPLPALAYNSAKRYFRVGGSGGVTFGLGTRGSSQISPLTLQGFDALPQLITKAMFGPDDRLYLLAEGKLFISNAPVK